MELYSEITSKSLIDFEEIKFILANNNIKLIKSGQIKERYFLKEEISFKNASYKKILENTYVLQESNDKKYLVYRTADCYNKMVSKIEISNENDCVDFLKHIGFKELFTIEKNVYDYSDGNNILSIIVLINKGIYLSVKKENTNFEELKIVLNSFKIPYKEDECNELIEKTVISKLRRYL